MLLAVVDEAFRHRLVSGLSQQDTSSQLVTRWAYRIKDSASGNVIIYVCVAYQLHIISMGELTDWRTWSSIASEASPQWGGGRKTL